MKITDPYEPLPSEYDMWTFAAVIMGWSATFYWIGAAVTIWGIQ